MNLHSLRVPTSSLRGRRYVEPPHPFRTDFQRDRDRIIHARAFRRLEDKTQVFGVRLSDHFRNRLTHTIEVAQVARTVAVQLGLDEDFTEALALAHDIGHPPFAHSGETELDICMRRFGARFDHNVNALHIVERFEQRYARFAGLNLTFEVREGMVKHSRDFEPGDNAEFDEFLPGLRPPLEAQLIDVADEIAYNSADLDDAYSARFFTLDEIAAAVPHYGELLSDVRRTYPQASERAHFQEVLRGLINFLVTSFIDGTAQAVTASGVASVDDVRAYRERLPRLTASAQETNSALKRFLTTRVYRSEKLTRERERATRLIRELFDYFLAYPEQLPDSHRARMLELEPHRVVCDYIAGMTDGFCRRTARRLLDLR